MINSKHAARVHLHLYRAIGLVAGYLQRTVVGDPWFYSGFSPRRKELSYTATLEASPEEVFPLLCPVREYDWIEDWKCELIHSRSGFNEKGCVFTTRLALGETWVTSQYEPSQAVEFIINVAGQLAVTFGATLEATERGTEICWTRTLTALAPVGNRVVERYTEAAYQKEMERLRRRLEHYLATGQCLRTGESLVNRAL